MKRLSLTANVLLSEIKLALRPKDQESTLGKKVMGRRCLTSISSKEQLSGDQATREQVPGLGPVGNGGHPTTPVEDMPGPGWTEGNSTDTKKKTVQEEEECGHGS